MVMVDGNRNNRWANNLLSCVQKLCYPGPEQGKAYIVAYVLLTRARFQLTRVQTPYTQLTPTLKCTAPQQQLTRSIF